MGDSMTSLFAWIGSKERNTSNLVIHAFVTVAEDQFDLISDIWAVRNIPIARSGLVA